MKSEWRVGQVRHGEDVVWGVYRLRDADRPDERGNREWFKKGGYWAYCSSRAGAQKYADVFNALEKRTPPPATVTPEAAKPNNDSPIIAGRKGNCQ